MNLHSYMDRPGQIDSEGATAYEKFLRSCRISAS